MAAQGDHRSKGLAMDGNGESWVPAFAGMTNQ
jgi:hypothetical protein